MQQELVFCKNANIFKFNIIFLAVQLFELLKSVALTLFPK